MLPLAVKVEAPATVNAAVPKIAPVLAVEVNPWKVEPPVENVMLEAFKSKAVILMLFAELMPFTVMAPAVLSPTVNVPAVIFPNSVPEIVIFPVVDPRPMLPPSDTRIVAVAIPVLIDPARPKSFAVIESALPPDEIAPAVLLKSPEPSSFESLSKIVGLLVVKSTL